MTMTIVASLIAPFALQVAAPASSPGVASFEDLPIEQTTGPRCGVAFAIVQGWQEAGNARGGAFPNMAEANAREFFLIAMVRLIDAYSLERPDVTRLVEAEKARHQADNFATVEAMMPGCLALLELSSTSRAN
jgi:hypothetical protein